MFKIGDVVVAINPHDKYNYLSPLYPKNILGRMGKIVSSTKGGSSFTYIVCFGEYGEIKMYANELEKIL